MPEMKPPGAEALQKAALQMIAAARAMLDVAESIVLDPDAIKHAAGTASIFAKTVVDAVVKASGNAPADDDESIEHIDLS
jgi:hypothetical protein